MTVAAVAVVAVGLTGAGAVLVNLVERTLIDRVRASDHAALERVAAIVEATGQIPDVVPFVSADTQLIQILSPDGRVLAASLRVYEREPMVVGGEFHEPSEASIDRVRWQVSRVQVASPRGPLVIVAASPLTEVDRSVDALVDGLWLGVPAVVVLVGVLAWTLIGRALRPIEAIRSQVEEISATTMDRRVPEPGTGDEVDRLARTMNVMLGRLEEASARQRRFVSDASHELRSPVATIRTELEVALRNPDAADWPAVARGVLAEDRRLEWLLSDLLELARLDEASPTPFEDVDLDDLALDAATRLRSSPSTVAGLAVDTSRVSAGRVTGSPRQLERVLRNLLDNAGRHAASIVRVEVTREDGEVVLAVEGDGEGVPPGDRERVFERFTRLGDGRSRDGGGAGLGLALVREIALHHRGTVSVTDGELGGARFVVRLPAAR
jgi:signal transduction histidine kinase